MTIVLEIDYQAAKRKLAAQSEYLRLLDEAQAAAHAARRPHDVPILAGLVALNSDPDTDAQDIVERYDQQAMARRERQEMLRPRPHVVGAL